PILANDTNELIQRICRSNIFLHSLSTTIKRHLIRSRTNITIIGISHFARAIYDTTHNADLQAFQMTGTTADHLCRHHQVEQGAPATWAGDIFRFGDTRTCRLQNAKGGRSYYFSFDTWRIDPDAIAETVDQEGAKISCR